MRDQLARSEDWPCSTGMLEQARAAVDALAVPDCSAHVAVLRARRRRWRPSRPNSGRASSWLAGVEAELATVTARVDGVCPAVRAGHEDRWWRRSRGEVVPAAGAEL